MIMNLRLFSCLRLPALCLLYLLQIAFWPGVALSAGTLDDLPLMDQALAAVGATRADLSFRPDLSPNPALPFFGPWISAPLELPALIQERASQLFALAPWPHLWFEHLADLGGADPQALRSIKTLPEPLSLPSDLPQELQESLQDLYGVIYQASIRLSQAIEKVGPVLGTLMSAYGHPSLQGRFPSREEFTPSPLSSEWKEALALAGAVDRGEILGAGAAVLEVVGRARDRLLADPIGFRHIRSFVLETELGLVKIGGTGPDTYERDAILIIDLGGNDLYRGRTAWGGPGQVSVVLDLAGDDVYLGENHSQGSAVGGIGILWDVEGNDLYRAGNWSQGAGFLGLGLLMDEAGEDQYLGGAFVQGASAWGWAGLIDLEGEDTYVCRNSGQAYAGPFGVSVLCDLEGNDRYLAGIGSPDFREPGVNQGFAQGFSMGLRDLAAGGFALLADQKGNDHYQLPYFGQGAAYWMGVGVLYDQAGQDSYVARRYAQGAGIHYALGLLLDEGGNDAFVSWGVSQGCGHDYGIGMLVNVAGDDSYVSDWLSMGASKANGVGILIDQAGDDRYASKSPMPVGELDEGRRAGGMGLFVDAGGKDHYTRSGADNSLWGDHLWCVGIDRNQGQVSGLHLQEKDRGEGPEVISRTRKRQRKEERHGLQRAQTAPATSRAGQMEHLLLLAARSGVDQEIQQQSRKRLMGVASEESLLFLTDLLDTPDVETLLFMRDFFLRKAYHALPLLTLKTKDPDPEVRSRAFYFLGALKDTRALSACWNALHDPSWKVRSAAIRAIGDMLDQDRLSSFAPMQEALTSGLEQETLEPLLTYLEEEETRRPQILSVAVRALPLGYDEYERFSAPNQYRAVEERKAFARFLYDHGSTLLQLLECWAEDIQGSRDTARGLLPFLEDPDPAVVRAAAWALGQTRYEPALPFLLPLLGRGHLWVRDAATLSLSLFGDEAIPLLEQAMQQGEAPFRIRALEVLLRIGSPLARSIAASYLEDPCGNVARAARKALEQMKKGEKGGP